jgi:hypothetical protein
MKRRDLILGLAGAAVVGRVGRGGSSPLRLRGWVFSSPALLPKPELMLTRSVKD